MAFSEEDKILIKVLQARTWLWSEKVSEGIFE